MKLYWNRKNFCLYAAMKFVSFSLVCARIVQLPGSLMSTILIYILAMNSSTYVTIHIHIVLSLFLSMYLSSNSFKYVFHFIDHDGISISFCREETEKSSQKKKEREREQSAKLQFQWKQESFHWNETTNGETFLWSKLKFSVMHKNDWIAVGIVVALFSDFIASFDMKVLSVFFSLIALPFLHHTTQYLQYYCNSTLKFQVICVMLDGFLNNSIVSFSIIMLL